MINPTGVSRPLADLRHLRTTAADRVLALLRRAEAALTRGLDRLWPWLEALLLGRHRACRWIAWGVVVLCAAVAVRVWVGVIE